MALTKVDDRGLKTPIDLQDNEMIRLGDSADLKLYHDGSQSFILETGTGPLNIKSSQVNIQAANGDNMINVIQDSEVQLRYDGAKKLETTVNGADLTGSSTFSQQKFKTSDGTNRGGLYATNTDRLYLLDGQDHKFFEGIKDSKITLYHDNVEICRSYTSGFEVIGALYASSVDLNDNQKILLGTGDDLEIYHNAGFSYIDAKGDQLRIDADQLRVRSDSGESYIEADANSAVKLYFDNSNKFQTTSAGVEVSGDIKIDDATKGVEVGNVSGDNYTKFRHEIATNSGDSIVGFVAQNNNGSIIENLQGSTNQFLFLGDTDKDQGGTTLFGISTNVGATVYPRLTLFGNGDLKLARHLVIPDKVIHDGDTDTAILFPAADTFTVETAGTERIRVNSDGYFQNHKLPAVSYSDTRELALTNTDLTRSNFYNHTNFESDSTILDNNGHFIAPVHGIYRLYVRISTDGDAGNRANIRLRKNGTTINEAYAELSQGTKASVSSEIIAELNQGQYLDVQVAQMHTMSGSQHKIVNFHMLG